MKIIKKLKSEEIVNLFNTLILTVKTAVGFNAYKMDFQSRRKYNAMPNIIKFTGIYMNTTLYFNNNLTNIYPKLQSLLDNLSDRKYKYFVKIINHNNIFQFYKFCENNFDMYLSNIYGLNGNIFQIIEIFQTDLVGLEITEIKRNINNMKIEKQNYENKILNLNNSITAKIQEIKNLKLSRNDS